MSLTEAYARVQAMKERPWEPPSEIVEFISSSFWEEMDREITSGELKVMLDGVGWTSRCLYENDLDIEESMMVVASIERNVRIGMSRLEKQREADELAIGIGAGFYTGLWMGLLINKPPEDE